MTNQANLSPTIKSAKDYTQFLWKQANQLEAGRVDINEAKAQALIAKQINNLFQNEFNRANLMMKIHVFNENSNGNKIQIRELEEQNEKD